MAVGGCGEYDEREKSEGKTNDMLHTASGTLNACTIVTQQEIQEVLGEVVRSPRLTSPRFKMTVCSWMSQGDQTKSVLTVVYHTEAPLITWEQLKNQSEEYDIEIQHVEGLGDLAGWTATTGDLQVWASGKKIQIGRPIASHLEKQRALVQLALTRIQP